MHTVRPMKSRVTGGLRAGPPGGQVGRAEQPPVALPGQVHDLGAGQVGADRLGHEPLVEGPPGRLDLLLPAGARRLGLVQDPLVGRGQRRVGEPGPGRGHAAAQVHLGRGGPVLAEQRLGGRDPGAHPGRHRVPVPGVADRVLHHLAQRQPAVPLHQQQPGPERRGHARREQAVARHQVKTEITERFQRGSAGRRALAVQHENPARPGAAVRRGVADDRHLAADAVHVRLDDLQHQAGRGGGVERGATRLQHRHPGTGGQPVRRRHHAERARELRPGGERGALRHHRLSWG